MESGPGNDMGQFEKISAWPTTQSLSYTNDVKHTT
jgi:hypothetical protein